MSGRRLLFQWASTITIQLILFFLYKADIYHHQFGPFHYFCPPEIKCVRETGLTRQINEWQTKLTSSCILLRCFLNFLIEMIVFPLLWSTNSSIQCKKKMVAVNKIILSFRTLSHIDCHKYNPFLSFFPVVWLFVPGF
jgi:hypothetical protein